MPVGLDVYDQEHEAPARRGNVIDLWGVEEDWEFGTQGSLALQPKPARVEEVPENTRKQRSFRLLALAASVTVPGWLRLKPPALPRGQGSASVMKPVRRPVEHAGPRRWSSWPPGAWSPCS